jgi:hypothetical protein
VLIEEIGHFVDQELNSSDSPSDEGDIFQQLVQDKDISDGEMVDLKPEDDSETIALYGKEFSVETATPYTSYTFNSIKIKALNISNDGIGEDGVDQPLVEIEGSRFQLYDRNFNVLDEDGVEKNEIEQIWGSVDNINTFTNVTLSEKGSNEYEEIYTINVLNLSQSQK